MAVSTAAGALAVRWAQVLEVTTTVGEVGTGLAQPKFTEGEGGPVTLRAGPVVQQVVSEAPSELCRLLTLADVEESAFRRGRFGIPAPGEDEHAGQACL